MSSPWVITTNLKRSLKRKKGKNSGKGRDIQLRSFQINIGSDSPSLMLSDVRIIRDTCVTLNKCVCKTKTHFIVKKSPLDRSSSRDHCAVAALLLLRRS